MSHAGEAWIESPRKRQLEIALVSPLLPAAGSLALVNKFVPTLYEVPRSLYPGHEFATSKLGDPNRDTPALRWLRRAMVDELPQLLDIKAGKMTLIGPRADEPAHIVQLFDAIKDDRLREQWQYVRSRQKPGIISSYAVHSHRHNLAGVSESCRFSEEEMRTANATQRATMDIDDFENASLARELTLLRATASMAIGNYSQYAMNVVQRQPQPSVE